MSRMRRRKGMALQVRASVFAALGDETRLAVLAKLCKSEPQSISRLTEGSKLSRQAVTKHLRVLEGAGVVRCVRAGREVSSSSSQSQLRDARQYLDRVSAQWDATLARLKSFVEGSGYRVRAGRASPSCCFKSPFGGDLNELGEGVHPRQPSPHFARRPSRACLVTLAANPSSSEA